MNPPAFPCFMDVEATGFGPESYPIEVAWSNEAGEIQRYLINPESIPTWNSWNSEAEAIHGIDRERLERNGWDPQFVATRLSEELRGKIVYTDAPDFDSVWINRLFIAVQQPLVFRFEHVDELLLAEMRQPPEAIWQVLLRIEALKNNLAQGRTGKHAAGYDVGYLLQLWRSARGELVKMNHGVGPMPLTTATGTFQRLKINN